MNHRKPRTAATVVEVVVVVAILAALCGLLTAAVQKARLSAVRTSATNIARQLMMATHSYAERYNDQLLSFDGRPASSGGAVPMHLAPFLDGPRDEPPPFLSLRSDPSNPETTGPRAVPPRGDEYAPPAKCSFAFNGFCYAAGVQLSRSITDGLSSTIGVSEHYGECGGSLFGTTCNGSECHAVVNGVLKTVPCSRASFRRATFADRPMYDDVYPVTTVRDGRAATVGSLPLTFQVRPALADCDPRIPNSSVPGGILAGMLDGSVRFVRPEIAPEAFWGSVTPAGGEVVSLD